MYTIKEELFVGTFSMYFMCRDIPTIQNSNLKANSIENINTQTLHYKILSKQENKYPQKKTSKEYFIQQF